MLLGILSLIALCCLLLIPQEARADNLYGITFDEGCKGAVSAWDPGDNSEMSKVAEAR